MGAETCRVCRLPALFFCSVMGRASTSCYCLANKPLRPPQGLGNDTTRAYWAAVKAGTQKLPNGGR